MAQAYMNMILIVKVILNIIISFYSPFFNCIQCLSCDLIVVSLFIGKLTDNLLLKGITWCNIYLGIKIKSPVFITTFITGSVLGVRKWSPSLYCSSQTLKLLSPSTCIIILCEKSQWLLRPSPYSPTTREKQIFASVG